MKHTNFIKRSIYYDRSKPAGADCNPLMGEAVADFLEYCEVDKGLRETTIKQYGTALDDFSRYLGNEARVRIVDLLRLRKYKKNLCNRGQGDDKRGKLCARSRNQKLAIIKSFLQFAGLMGWDTLPHDFVEFSKTDKVPPVYHEHDQLERIVHTLEQRASGGDPRELRKLCLVRLYIDCGLRVSDMRQLKDAQFPLESLERVLDERRAYSVLIKVQKTRNFGRIWLTLATVEAVVRYLKSKREMKVSNPYLFCSLEYKKAGPLSAFSLLRMTKEIGRDAGIANWEHEFNHKYRHTCGMEYLHAKKFGLLDVQKILMHKSIESTLWYVETSDAQIEEKLNQLCAE